MSETHEAKRKRERANWIESISDDEVRCYQTEDGAWSVSIDKVWVCGAYETRETAARAPFVDVTGLAELWNRKCPESITAADLDGIDGETS